MSVPTVLPADVAAWGRFPVPVEPLELDLLATTISASLEQLGRDFHLDDPLTSGQRTAVIMQAARIWARRNTPEGRASFGGDIAVSVVSFDAGVYELLQPRFGIA